MYLPLIKFEIQRACQDCLLIESNICVPHLDKHLETDMHCIGIKAKRLTRRRKMNRNATAKTFPSLVPIEKPLSFKRDLWMIGFSFSLHTNVIEVNTNTSSASFWKEKQYSILHNTLIHQGIYRFSIFLKKIITTHEIISVYWINVNNGLCRRSSVYLTALLSLIFFPETVHSVVNVVTMAAEY